MAIVTSRKSIQCAAWRDADDGRVVICAVDEEEEVVGAEVLEQFPVKTNEPPVLMLEHTPSVYVLTEPDCPAEHVTGGSA